MSYLYLNLFDPRGRGGELNPDEHIARLKRYFQEAIVLPGDQLALSARRAEEKLDRANPADQAVIRKLWWDAQHLGPAYTFQIPAGQNGPIKGVIKRYQADFHSDATISEGMRARIKAFLFSLIPAGISTEVCEESDEEVAAGTSQY